MNKCCASACGDFCGAPNCNEGPGVSGSCCGSTIPDEDLCGSVKDIAPCTIGKIGYLYLYSHRLKLLCLSYEKLIS